MNPYQAPARPCGAPPLPAPLPLLHEHLRELLATHTEPALLACALRRVFRAPEGWFIPTPEPESSFLWLMTELPPSSGVPCFGWGRLSYLTVVERWVLEIWPPLREVAAGGRPTHLHDPGAIAKVLAYRASAELLCGAFEAADAEGAPPSTVEVAARLRAFGLEAEALPGSPALLAGEVLWERGERAEEGWSVLPLEVAAHVGARASFVGRRELGEACAAWASRLVFVSAAQRLARHSGGGA